MKNMILAVIFTAAPAAAQTTVRVPTSGVNVMPSLGATPVPTIMMMLALTITPHAAAAKPIGGSPLAAILDASADAAQKTAALNRTFENTAPPRPEALEVSARPDIQLRGTPVDPAALAAQGPNEFSQAPVWFDASQLKFDALVKSGTGGTAVLRYGWRSQYEMSVFAFDAALETAPGRKAAAKLLRAAQARNPVSGKDKAALDEILSFLEAA